MRSSASSASWTLDENTPRSVRAIASRRSSTVSAVQSVGSENSVFSKKLSPRVNSVTCGEITVIVETPCRKSSLSIAAAVSPPPITATRSALIRSCPPARCQNCAIESTRGFPGSRDRSACPGPVIIKPSACTVISSVCSAQRSPSTASCSTSPETTVMSICSATQRRYWLHRRWVGAGRPRSIHWANWPVAIRYDCQLNRVIRSSSSALRRGTSDDRYGNPTSFSGLVPSRCAPSVQPPLDCQLAPTPIRSTATTSGGSTPIWPSTYALAATATALTPAPSTASVVISPSPRAPHSKVL